MKLIDILVEELPKRGGWPECVSKISSTSCGRVFFDGQSPHGFTLPVASDAWDSHKHPFSYTNAVTREQYEAALAAKNEGWIEWGGGECPVEKGTLVDVKLRCGSVTRQRSGESLDWQHDGKYELGAIIAYRLHQLQDATTRANDYMLPQDFCPVADEADLNECIGQDAAPVWNGEGVTPPVGCVCERSWAGDEWLSCRILFASDQIVVIKLEESGIDDAYNIGDVTFRPIRTEAERKRDAAVDAFNCLSPIELSGELAYDAIAAGKIPGVKLEG